MTRDEFTSNAIALVGGGHGWQSRLARRLDVNDRTIRRAVANGPSDSLARLLLEVIGEVAPQGVLPEWILGTGNDGREYVIHTYRPRFTCRIVAQGDDYDEASDDGVKYQNGDDMLCQFVWHDTRSDNLAALLERACNTIDDITGL